MQDRSNHQNLISFKQFLKESKNPLVAEFLDIFGFLAVSGKVSSPQKNFHRDMFETLNKIVFNSRLPLVDVKYVSYENIISEMKKSGVDQLPENNFLGVHHVDIQNPEEFEQCLRSSDVKKAVNNLKLENDIIFLNSSILEGKTFAFHASSLCHEMIHMFDKFFGEYKTAVLIERIKHVTVDFHTTPTFIQKKKDALNMNLNIIDKIEGDSGSFSVNYEKLDFETAELLLSSMSEKEDAENSRSLLPSERNRSIWTI